MSDFRDIIKTAASRKLVDLSKFFLDTLDEIKKESAANKEKFATLAVKWEIPERDVDALLMFLSVFDDCKSEIYRKRILDKMNELKRELEN